MYSIKVSRQTSLWSALAAHDTSFYVSLSIINISVLHLTQRMSQTKIQQQNSYHTSICPLTRASSGGRGRSFSAPPLLLLRLSVEDGDSHIIIKFSAKKIKLSSLSTFTVKQRLHFFTICTLNRIEYLLFSESSYSSSSSSLSKIIQTHYKQ